MDDIKKKLREYRAKELIKALNKNYKNSKLVLKYKTNFELMVAVQMSAQSTDKKVNEITRELFKKYKTLDDYVNADLQEFQKDIGSVLYYKNKGKNILNAAKIIKTKFKGRLPKTMEEMLTIPGVARKTANVLLGTLFNVYDGIVVDTHMCRFAIRFDLSDYKDPVKIERDLMEIISKKEWYSFSYKVVDYGREYGNPRKRDLHNKDLLIKVFPKAENNWPKY